MLPTVPPHTRCNLGTQDAGKPGRGSGWGWGRGGACGICGAAVKLLEAGWD